MDLAEKGAKTGYRVDVPQYWNLAGDIAKNFARSGGAVSASPWYQQAKQVAQADIEKAIEQAAEQAGLSGLRWSTPLGRTAQQVAGDIMGKVGLEWTGREMQALENARQRQLAGSQLLQSLGAGVAGLRTDAANRALAYNQLLQQYGTGLAGLEKAGRGEALQAAAQLLPLAQMYDTMPQTWAANMYQMGTGMQGLRQGALDRFYRDFLRMTPEASPWLAGGLNFLGLPSQMVPQQYQPSFLSQLFGGLLGGAGLAAGLGWKPF
ncbi:MAG: hypothetical protein JRI41_06790 [Deltaproteobacteria bacterium]|nr:hypothetical protein [Deltaproteobacteria bacterium]